jgi:hypothetical protein
MSTLLNNFREKTQRAGLVRLLAHLPNRRVCNCGSSPWRNLRESQSAATSLRLRPLSVRLRNLSEHRLDVHTCNCVSGTAIGTEYCVVTPLTRTSLCLVSKSGWRREVGPHQHADVAHAPAGHLQCHWRHHDHQDGRAREQARKLHPVHPGKGCGGT